jgi:phospholipid-translocating ATPase
LNLENTLWANTILATGKILGIALFVGKETRIAMNSRNPISKMGKFDEEVNLISKVLFFIMVVISFIILIFNGF